MSGRIIFALILSFLWLLVCHWGRYVAYKKGYAEGYKDCKLELLQKGNEP